MKNVEMTQDGDILTIKVDLSKEFGPSSSGKTTIIASTEGNQPIPDKEDIKIGLNIYRKKQSDKWKPISNLNYDSKKLLVHYDY